MDKVRKISYFKISNLIFYRTSRRVVLIFFRLCNRVGKTSVPFSVYKLHNNKVKKNKYLLPYAS